jgi:hypothetical protein
VVLLGLSYQSHILLGEIKKGCIFLFVIACFFFRFGYVADAEFCAAADFYAYFGGEAGAGYQGS